MLEIWFVRELVDGFLITLRKAFWMFQWMGSGFRRRYMSRMMRPWHYVNCWFNETFVHGSPMIRYLLCRVRKF
jgi:hypothetical protein